MKSFICILICIIFNQHLIEATKSDYVISTSVCKHLKKYFYCRQPKKANESKSSLRHFDEEVLKSSFECPLNQFECVDRRRTLCLNETNSCQKDKFIFMVCQSDEFECRISKRCIPRRWLRDGIDDCGSDRFGNPDRSDEDNKIQIPCTSEEFRCVAGNRCLERDDVMDGRTQCIDGSDENRALPSCLATEFRCSNGRCIARKLVNDGNRDCLKGEDESHPENVCMKSEFDCGEGQCIPETFVNDSIKDCKNGSDEKSKKHLNCSENQFRCHDNNSCIAKNLKCDGRRDCFDCSDETSCQTMFSCQGSTKCVPWSYTCDSRSDCPNGSDEMTSHKLGYKCGSCLVPQFAVVKQLDLGICKSCDYCSHGKSKSFKCLDGSLISLNQVCDDVIDCPDLSDECMCEHAPLCAACVASFPGFRVDNSMTSCCNVTSSTTCKTDRFCNLQKDCLNEIDEAFCPMTSSFLRPKESMICRDSKSLKWSCSSGNETIKVETRFDGRVDCADGSDECSIHSHQNRGFASNTQMISAVYFQCFFFIVAVFTIFGNLIVFYYTIKKLRSYTETKRSIFFYNRILIGNLAVADALMGLCFLALASKSFIYDRGYCDVTWRGSLLCTLIGILGSISSQTSINIVLLMTFLRLRSTVSPFRPYVINNKAFYLLVGLSWLIAILSAIYPYLNIVEEVLIEKHPFFKSKILDQNKMDIYYSNMEIIYPGNFPKRKQWYQLPAEVAKNFPGYQINIRSYYGYYNSLAICFPDFFVPSEQQMFMRIAVCVYNGCVLMFVAFSYIYIYKISTRSGTRSKVRDNENEKMKYRMTLVVVIDVMMLIPIIVMVIVNILVPDKVNPSICSKISIILLPISSFINPLLYGRIHRNIQNSILIEMPQTLLKKARKSLTEADHLDVT